MIEKVKQAIIEYGLLNPKETVVIGLSAGPDSVALTVSLAEIALSMELKLIVAHFNHGLRGQESDEDEEHAQRIARDLGLSFVVGKMGKTVCKRGCSPEEYYRDQRYRFLDSIARNNRACKIALGHNLQDQAETVMLHFLRGSGLSGLQGIMPVRDGIYIRPMLSISRKEIIDFLDKTGVSCRHDSSNKSMLHLRNKIRLELMPYLAQEFNPRIRETLAQTAEIIREENKYIEERVELALQTPFVRIDKSKVLLNIEYIHSLPLAIQRRVLKEILERFTRNKNGFAFSHIAAIIKLLHKKESGRRISLPLGLEARIEYENLIIERMNEWRKMTDYQYEAAIPSEIRIKERNLTVRLQKVQKNKIDFTAENKDYFDLDKIRQPLILRNRREGDWFRPLGMPGRQKLKSFFIDHKITRQKRDEIMLLADRQSVIWIEKMHLSDQVKITPETKNVLELEII